MRRSVVAWLVAGLGVVACANGRSDGTDGTGVANDTSNATTPPSHPLPAPSGSAGSDGDASSGGSSGSSSGSSGSSGSSASSSGSSGSSSGSSGGGGCTPPVPGGVCGLHPQCGCPAGFTCDEPGSGGITDCEPAGAGPLYSSCVVTSQCAVGLTCMDGACKPFCNVAADCSGGGERRCVQVTYEGFPVPGFLICTSACDPTNPAASCGPGVTCLAASIGYTDCVGPASSGTDGAPCSIGSLLCAPGYVCMTAAGSGVCKKWCHVGGADCASGETCSAPPLSGLVTVAGVTYGGCQPP